MGVYWNEVGSVAFGMLVVPDGRIVCQRPAEAESFIKKWQATVFRKVPDDVANPSYASGTVAMNSMMPVLGVEPDNVVGTHLASHFIESINKRLEIVIFKLKSGGKLHVPRFIEIKLMSFDDLLNDIDKNRKDYAAHTIHAANIMDTLATWRKRRNEVSC